MTPRGITSLSLLFQVRSLAHTLSEKAGLSTSFSGKQDAMREIEAAASKMVAPSLKRRAQKRRRPQSQADQRHILEDRAENYLKKHVLAQVPPEQRAQQDFKPVGAGDELKAIQKIVADMDKTLYPATLLSCLILTLRDAGKSLEDLDETGKVTAGRFLTLLAYEVYNAKARARLALLSPALPQAQKISLGREVTMATQLLDGLAALVDVKLPEEETRHKVAIIEEATRRREACEASLLPDKKA